MMRMRRRCLRERGFTLLELLVVIAIIGILAVAALDRYWLLQESAEAAAMQQTLATLKTAVLVRSGELTVANKWEALRQLPKQNPFDLLAETPSNYTGTGSAPPGSWSFDARDALITYRVRRTATFVAPAGEAADLMRFRVVAIDAQGGAASKGAPLYLVRPLAEYRWQERVIR